MVIRFLLNSSMAKSNNEIGKVNGNSALAMHSGQNRPINGCFR